MAAKNPVVEENQVAPEDRMTYVTLPLLDEEKPGTVDQTEVVQCEGKNNNHPLIIQRGQRVEIPIWAFEALVHSGRYTVARPRGKEDTHTEYHTNL
jgi:hypothetical protein